MLWIPLVCVGYIVIAVLFFIGFGLKEVFRVKRTFPDQKLDVRDLMLSHLMTDYLQLSIIWPVTVAIYAAQFIVLACLMGSILVIETIVNNWPRK